MINTLFASGNSVGKCRLHGGSCINHSPRTLFIFLAGDNPQAVIIPVKTPRRDLFRPNSDADFFSALSFSVSVNRMLVDRSGVRRIRTNSSTRSQGSIVKFIRSDWRFTSDSTIHRKPFHNLKTSCCQFDDTIDRDLHRRSFPHQFEGTLAVVD